MSSSEKFYNEDGTYTIISLLKKIEKYRIVKIEDEGKPVEYWTATDDGDLLQGFDTLMEARKWASDNS